MMSRLLETNCIMKEGKKGHAGRMVVSTWHCLVAGGEADRGGTRQAGDYFVK